MLWNSLGRQRSGVIFDDMKNARNTFKKALSHCRANEINLRKRKFMNSFHCKDKRNFWRDVRKMTPCPSSQVIDGTSVPEEIINIFDRRYKNILDDEKCYSDYPSLADINGKSINKVFFQPSIINQAIDRLNTGIGFDRIHAFHLKYSGDIFRNPLGRYFSSCLSHSYLPEDMIKGVIRPVLKGNSCKTKAENYRPVMSSSLMFKALEYCLLPTLYNSLKIDPLQFGFQA